MPFVCNRTVSKASVHKLKTKYDQDKFGVVLWQTKSVVSFRLDIVNEHHIIRKSHDATHEKCPRMVHFNVPRDWFEKKL